jgi:SAM-dependent methyltransferase
MNHDDHRPLRLSSAALILGLVSTTDVVDLRSFYASPLGHVARRFVGRAVLKLWPDARGLKLVGLGYAVPYLTLLRDGAERTLAFMPAQQGVVNWPAAQASASALIDPLLLPLDDASVERVMVAHALETSESAEELLAECWRVLAPGGRLMVIAPNRRGLWARMDGTPFGHGRPFSRAQLEALMRATLFSPETWTEALYCPPLTRPVVLRSAAALERIGAGIGAPFSGVHVIDATKQFYRRAPAKARRSFQLRQVLAPLPAPAASAGREALGRQA